MNPILIWIIGSCFHYITKSNAFLTKNVFLRTTDGSWFCYMACNVIFTSGEISCVQICITIKLWVEYCHNWTNINFVQRGVQVSNSQVDVVSSWGVTFLVPRLEYTIPWKCWYPGSLHHRIRGSNYKMYEITSFFSLRKDCDYLCPFWCREIIDNANICFFLFFVCFSEKNHQVACYTYSPPHGDVYWSLSLPQWWGSPSS